MRADLAVAWVSHSWVEDLALGRAEMKRVVVVAAAVD